MPASTVVRQHTWISVWFLISSLVVLWDTGYMFSRPRSFQGGDLHWIWKPYALYQNIDFVYGVEAYNRTDGFGAAQSFLNLFESAANFLYVWKVHVSNDPVAPLLGFAAALATFHKTALYWFQEYFCNYCAVGHNNFMTLFIFWIIPNGFWLVFPALICWTLWGDIASSLKITSTSTSTSTSASKAVRSGNGTIQNGSAKTNKKTA